MPTIRTLLDRYGRPPNAVALDWAWQIRQHLDSPHPEVDARLPCERDWTELEVAEDGHLLCQQLDQRAALQALRDLQYWEEYDTQAQAENESVNGAHDELLQSVPAEVVVPNARPQRSQSRRAVIFHSLWRGRAAWISTAVGILLVSGLLWYAARPSTGEATGSQASIEASKAEQQTELVQLEPLPMAEPESPVGRPDSVTAPGPTASTGLAQLDIVPSLIGPSTVPDTAVAKAEEGMANDSQTSKPDSAKEAATDSVTTNSTTSDDALRDVKQTLMQAEAEESVTIGNRAPDVVRGYRGDPWVLMRDTMRYRVSLSPKLRIDDRESQWRLALEPIAGLAVEPRKPVTISQRGMAIWRIYDADAKAPRASLFVRAVHQGRDGQLDLVFCGGAEDMSGVSVPLGQRWLEPLTVRVQSHTLELRGALAQLSTSVITRSQVPAVMQQKQALLGRMATAARLGVVLPEINRLVELADGQLTMHAMLKSKPDESPVASWGQP